jgi:RNA polymerase sigma-70 factor, ECF subfamily
MFWDRSTSHSDAIVTEFLDGLYSYAMILVCNPTAAEGLVRETYAREIEVMGRPRGEARERKNRLFTILRNICFKRYGVLRHSIDSQDPYTSKTDHVRAAIQKLPTDLREVVFLREYEGLSYSEIAAILNCSASIVAPQLSRAREKLRMLLAAELNAPIHPQGKKQEKRASGASPLLFFKEETFPQ